MHIAQIERYTTAMQPVLIWSLFFLLFMCDFHWVHLWLFRCFRNVLIIRWNFQLLLITFISASLCFSYSICTTMDWKHYFNFFRWCCFFLLKCSLLHNKTSFSLSAFYEFKHIYSRTIAIICWIVLVPNNFVLIFMIFTCVIWFFNFFLVPFCDSFYSLLTFIHDQFMLNSNFEMSKNEKVRGTNSTARKNKWKYHC